MPHNAVLDIGTAQKVTGITYLPRQDVPTGGKINGNIGNYTVGLSSDNLIYTTVASGTFVDDATKKTVYFTSTTARYVKIIATTEAGNRGPWTSAAEFQVLVLKIGR